MHTRMRAISLCLTLAALLAAVSLSQPSNAAAPRSSATGALQAAMPELTGAYRITSATAPSGGAYTGTAQITRSGGAYRMTWDVGGDAAPEYEGVGVQMDDMLGVGWGERGGSYAVVVYRLNGGRLAGRWSVTGANTVWVEDLEGPASLNGSYRITRSTSPDANGSYTGTVEIAPRGEVYAVRWRIASGESFSGIGLRQGNLLVVGWGTGQNVSAVAVYQARGATLLGRWAVPNETRAGTENFTRQ